MSYSCMANIKSIIDVHNKEVITDKKTQGKKHNCISKSDILEQISTVSY